MIRIILYGALMWGVCLYAFMRGGRAERLVSVGIIVASYMTTLASFFLTSLTARYQHVEVSILVIDLGLLLLLLYIATISEKFWPIWLTSMQSLTCLAHLAPYVPHVLPWSYWRAIAIWSYPMLIVLGCAIYVNSRDQRAGRSGDKRRRGKA